MKHFLILLFTLSFITSSFSQYTEIINSKRPGFSESPYGVGTNVFQVETGAFFEDNPVTETWTTDQSYGANVFLRYGKFLEKLELNLDFAYQFDKRVFSNVLSSSYNVNGISKLTFGAKYLVYNQKYTDKSKEVRSWKKRMSFDKKRLIPSVGVYVGLNTNILGEDFKEEGMSPKAAILLQNDINSRFVVLTNLIYDRIGKERANYGYILTATYALDQKWSMFGEHQGSLYKNFSNEFQFGVGAAYLLSKNIQLDASARTKFIGEQNNIYISFGGAWRLDKHQKEKKSEDVLKGEKKEPFFKRLFKKNKNKRPKTKKIKTKKRKKNRSKGPSFHKKDKK